MKPTILPIFLPYSGCKERCIFCNQRITGYSADQKLFDDVETRIEKYYNLRKKNIGPVQIALYGGTFSGLQCEEMAGYLKSLHRFITDGKVESIRISTRPDELDRERIQFLAGYGVKTVELGVPSMVQSVLDAANRNHSVADIIRARQLLAEQDIETGFQLMYGLPGDTTRTRIETLRAVRNVHPDFVRIHPAVVLRGTALEKLFLSGQYQPLSLAKAVVIAAHWSVFFHSCNITIVRIGLQAVDAMEMDKSVVAGPFHPAFGELVKQYIRRKELLRILSQRSTLPAMMEIEVPHNTLSQYIGQHGATKKWLLQRFPAVESLVIKEGDVTHPRISESRLD